MKSVVLAAVAIVGFASSAAAKQEYAAYEGRDAVREGTGGTKVTKNGIDFWTSGAPPRRYQVLGVLTDKRKDRLFDGNVIGSASVAKKTKEAGGDAVILAGSSARSAGLVSTADAYGTGNGISAFGTTREITRTTTELVVIKYL